VAAPDPVSTPPDPTPSDPTPPDPSVNTGAWGNGSGGPMPILLDLTGHGINITELNRSSTFMDATGSGLSNRTAWAGAGTAVLFFDPNSLNKIIDRNQYIFTQWDPTATSDMQALRDVFDSNGDGVFDMNDAKWASFKLMLTNAQAQLRLRSLHSFNKVTTTGETLDQADIMSINLEADTTHVNFTDGSSVNGQTKFTRKDGTTGTVASVTLLSDAANDNAWGTRWVA